MKQREIKFRVWDKETKTLNNDDGILLNFGQKIASFYLEKEQYLYNVDRSFDEIILSQYTGLKDCEGKEIYEGDVFKSEDGEVVSISAPQWFSCDAFDCFGYEELSGYFHTMGKELGDRLLERIRVIGNIYENPELLKDPS